MPEQPAKPKRPWSGFDYLIIIIIALLVALLLVWPLGSGVRNVFQILVNVFEKK